MKTFYRSIISFMHDYERRDDFLCSSGNFKRRLRSFIIIKVSTPSLPRYCFHLLLLLFFVLFISFNVYIIVFYGISLLCVCSTRERNSFAFSLHIGVFAFTILWRNHMCLIISTISLLPTCWNLWILRRRMEGFVEHSKLFFRVCFLTVFCFILSLWLLLKGVKLKVT